MQDRIKELAIEAGIPSAWISEKGVLQWSQLERFAQLVAEDCAKVCEDVDMFNYDDPGSTYASAIRARFGIKE